MVKCIDCLSSSTRKNGILNGNQRYECTYCGRHFILASKRSYSIHYKRELVGKTLIGGLSYRTINRLYGVSVNTLCAWVKLFKKGVI